MANGGFVGDGFDLDELTAVAYVTPKRTREVAKNVGRAARIVANNVPASVEQITIVIVERGMALGRVSLLRGDLERAVAGRGSTEEIWSDAVIERGQARPPQPMPKGAKLPMILPTFQLRRAALISSRISSPTATDRAALAALPSLALFTKAPTAYSLWVRTKFSQNGSFT